MLAGLATSFQADQRKGFVAVADEVKDLAKEAPKATEEMDRYVTEAARGGAEIAQNISSVAPAAQSTSSGATQTQASTGELSGMAMALQATTRPGSGLPRRPSRTGRNTRASIESPRFSMDGARAR